MKLKLPKKDILTIEKVEKNIRELSSSKVDHLITANKLLMIPQGAMQFQAGKKTKLISPSTWAQGQLYARLNMPSRYFKTMYKVHPSLVAAHVNANIKDKVKTDVEWMLRTYDDGTLRGTLSGSYTKLDNDYIVGVLKEQLKDIPHEISWYSTTDDSVFHLRVLFPDLKYNLGKIGKKNDEVVAGIHIVNSEVGASSLIVELVLYRLVCTNGLIVTVDGVASLRRRHIHINEDNFKERFVAAIQDCMNNQEVIELLKASKAAEIKPKKVDTLIDSLATRYKLPEKVKDGVVKEYGLESMRSGNTLFTLVNAFTAEARQLENVSQRLEVERIAGNILGTYSKGGNDWFTHS